MCTRILLLSMIVIEQRATDSIREWLQLFVLIIGIGGGLLTALKALVDLRENLRWKRANAAKDFLGEIHRHELASKAVLMMDWYDSQHEYEIKDGDKQTISYEDVLTALEKEQKDCKDDAERFIRDCFDWFFYFIDRIEHYVTVKLIRFDGVAPSSSPTQSS